MKFPLNISKYHIFALLSIIYASFIFYLSSLNDPTILTSEITNFQFIYSLIGFFEEQDVEVAVDFLLFSYEHFDKIVHMILYFGLGILLHLTFSNSDNKTLKHYAPFFAILIGIFYGITDEVHQSFVPGRSANTLDLFANGIGLALAQAIFWIIVLKNVYYNKKSGE